MDAFRNWGAIRSEDEHLHYRRLRLPYYLLGGKNHRLMTDDLVRHAGYANARNLTEVGGLSRRLLQLLVDWINRRHLPFALPTSGKPGDAPRFGSDFVVIVFDALNGLQQRDHRYAGLNYIPPAGKSVYVVYGQFMEELSPFSQVVYCYSDCAERYQMDSRQGDEARALAAMASNYGRIPYSLSTCLGADQALLLGHGKRRPRIKMLAPRGLPGAAQIAVPLGAVD